jgi:hypothetical protein
LCFQTEVSGFHIFRSFGKIKNFDFPKYSGVDSSIFCYRNFANQNQSNKIKVSNEVSIERKPEKTLEVWGKKDYCGVPYVKIAVIQNCRQ